MNTGIVLTVFVVIGVMYSTKVVVGFIFAVITKVIKGKSIYRQCYEQTACELSRWGERSHKNRVIQISVFFENDYRQEFLFGDSVRQLKNIIAFHNSLDEESKKKLQRVVDELKVTRISEDK
ncbi:hypothetical protein [Xenorhabdus szentirmaii]|uniref:Uncharacterized protein n=1 Tax=Xenorhabdus szentirmaii DSM 16338 TaxID=1427518 RepID=W1IRB5_9GAMM|nr:hypothetical protein [Xenorhabdus szentirmaii]PHM30549.1 hypothetical protein Xsze_04139 [Xenorhabdus szentirmaii DSM 16338]CDL81012.1 hypothetical protein XSR1_100061 [Xenorhabdus szentirmaii DSM 16338]